MDDELRARLAQQRGESAHREFDTARIDTALETRRSLAAQRQSLTRGTHRTRLEPRNFEGDRRRRVAHLAVAPTHDSRQADRPILRIADEEIVPGEVTGCTVEGDERFGVAGSADPHALADDVGVVRVVRLVELEHDEVRCIDDVVDRAHSRRGESSRVVRR